MSGMAPSVRASRRAKDNRIGLHYELPAEHRPKYSCVCPKSEKISGLTTTHSEMRLPRRHATPRAC